MRNKHLSPDYWVTLNKANDIFGYSAEALRGKIKRGQLAQGGQDRYTTEIVVDIDSPALWATRCVYCQEVSEFGRR